MNSRPVLILKLGVRAAYASARSWVRSSKQRASLALSAIPLLLLAGCGLVAGMKDDAANRRFVAEVQAGEDTLKVTDPATLVRLGAEENWRVREAVASNPHTPLASLVQLTSDPQMEVRRAATKQLTGRVAAMPTEQVLSLSNSYPPGSALNKGIVALEGRARPQVVRHLIFQTNDIQLAVEVARASSYPCDHELSDHFSRLMETTLSRPDSIELFAPCASIPLNCFKPEDALGEKIAALSLGAVERHGIRALEGGAAAFYSALSTSTRWGEMKARFDGILSGSDNEIFAFRLLVGGNGWDWATFTSWRSVVQPHLLRYIQTYGGREEKRKELDWAWNSIATLIDPEYVTSRLNYGEGLGPLYLRSGIHTAIHLTYCPHAERVRFLEAVENRYAIRRLELGKGWALVPVTIVEGPEQGRGDYFVIKDKYSASYKSRVLVQVSYNAGRLDCGDGSIALLVSLKEDGRTYLVKGGLETSEGYLDIRARIEQTVLLRYIMNLCGDTAQRVDSLGVFKQRW